MQDGIHRFFQAQFSKPFSSFGTWKDGAIHMGSSTQSGHPIGAFVGYTTTAQEVVLVKVGIFFVGMETARKNLTEEIGGWDFDRMRRQTKDGWNEILKRIEVEGGTDSDRTNFYTSLYRVMASDDREGPGLFRDVDWQRTKAYAVGFASMYVNLAGREGSGIVKQGSEYDELCKAISARLEQFVDPDSGYPVVHRAYRSNQIYHGGPLMDQGPDLLVGLKPGYRFSWQTALGAAPTKLIEDNTSRWSGDHIFDPSFMSGILLSNVRTNTRQPRGIDVAPTVLDCFGLTQPNYMTGTSLLKT